jgi:hypothetical protein
MRESIKILRGAGISIVPGFMVFNPYTTFETVDSDLAFLSETGFMPVLAKSLRVFDGTPIQRVLANDGRLVERDPFDGYHEYLMDRRIAAIYMALKRLSVGWIDPIKKANQQAIWRIKKSQSFHDRVDFDSLTRKLFNIEKEALVRFVSFVRNGFSRSDVAALLKGIRGGLADMETFVSSVSGCDRQDDCVDMVSCDSMADSIGTTLSEMKYETFPEKYRWHED